jgi:HK97 family phage major capsid protein
MELKEMNIEQLEARKSELLSQVETTEEREQLDAIEAEMKAIKAEFEERAKAEAEKNEIRKAIANDAVAAPVVKEFKEEKREMKTNEEIRKSQEYIDAYARYLVTENDAECRALLTSNVSGSVPVPVIVDEIIRTAWDESDILSRVRKTNIKGNLKVAFELAADGAYVHIEGTTAPTEESLTFGIVEMVPANIKKWIRISDEAIAMGGQALVEYIYKELMKRIIEKLEALVIADITGAPTSATSSKASVANITEAPSLVTVADAYALLCDEARNPVVIMNRATYADFIAAQAAGNFAFDPFRGLPVAYSSALPAYNSASANAAYMIVGDLEGEQVNYPEGEGIIIKYDDVTEAEADMVKIVGRQYAAHALTACKRFTVVKKPSAVTT